MLVLSRKVGDAIIIDDQIEIKILELHHGEVKIGISAPKNVVILRKEIYDAVRRQNRDAAQVPVDDELKSLLKKLVKKLDVKEEGEAT